LRNGIHIPAAVVWAATLAASAGLAYAAYQEWPPLRRYLKMESFSYG
jgi:uncharacterized membrane protein YebE (DUF533 family)